MSKRSLGVRFFAILIVVALCAIGLLAQETTGGLQGTVKDANGAVVPKASVELSGTALAGTKALVTDATGYYRFANLPPGTYTVSVKAEGFSTLKRENITIAVGHLPTLDLSLKVGSQATVVEVTAEAPVIDVAVSSTATNVSESVIADVPHGRSFQSVIQFAPSARNEPLAGSSGGTGGSTPGSSGNGLAYGFSVGGAADSENSYLVEGQDTASIQGGFSKANVPFEFIQEVQVKSSGIEAEHGGALGGVVNVVMKKGSNNLHGELFTAFESSGFDGSPDSYLRYDPTGMADPGGTGDTAVQTYRSKKDTFINVQPGVTIGGPLVKDRVWFFAGFAPYYQSVTRTVDFSTSPAGNLGPQPFVSNQLTYYTTGRLDATLTQRIRVFGSWLYQYARQQGDTLPNADSIDYNATTNPNYFNTSVATPITSYSHNLAWVAPNQTVNIGADITLTPKIVSTTRFGLFFENYRDDGWPTSGTDFNVRVTGVGVKLLDGSGTLLSAANPGLGIGPSSTAPLTTNYTAVNANKHYQFDQDIAAFKSGWAGTHNFKVGYQLNHLANVISQHPNVPWIRYYPGRAYGPGTSTGDANCAAIEASHALWTAHKTSCAGDAGYLYVDDFATVGNSVDWNHGIFFQDSWTVGKGITINAGLRLEKESIPAPPGNTLGGRDINFSWSDKIAPRIGGAWDVMQNGKLKVFGSYGVVNDIMKLLLAMTSFGGQNWDNCYYAVDPAFNAQTAVNVVNGRSCPTGDPSTLANWAGGNPAGLTFIENYNFRPQEPVAPGVKPYRQHESAFGADYQVAKNYALEIRWDRRRLDHILEDASLSDVNVGEVYTIVNPGEGVNKTVNGYATFLNSLGESFGSPGYSFNSATFGTCTGCPNMPKAVRNYDGIEVRLTKSISNHWAGMFSYTYSTLRGNYAGLTNTDQTDGGGTGRNSPDTSRAFDEPIEYFKADGTSSNGPLATDRPNTFKGFAYYQLKENKRHSSTIGIFQTMYQGSPIGSYMDVGGSFGDPSYAMYLWGRGQYIPSSAIPTGAAGITLGNASSARTPWFMQSDLNLGHEIKVDANNEHKVLAFEATISNLLNQHSIVEYYSGVNQSQNLGYLDTLATTSRTGNTYNGAAGYQSILTGFAKDNATLTALAQASSIVKDSWYGQAMQHQRSRTISVRWTFPTS
jgi:hypothetical protein